MNPKTKFLLGIGAAVIVAVSAPPQVHADDAGDAILKRLDALEKENGKLRAEIKRIEKKTTQKAEPKNAAPQAWPADTVPIAEADAQHEATVANGTMVPTSGQGYLVTAPSESGGWFFKKK